MKLCCFLALAGLGMAATSCAGDPPRPRARTAAAAGPSRERAEPLQELAPTEVVLAIRGNETKLRRCFFANPSARGFARVSWRIDREGGVSRVRLEQSTLHTKRVERCLLERVSELRFEPREHPARASWAFVFRLVDPPEQDEERSKRSKRSKRGQRDGAQEASESGVAVDPSSPGWLEPDAIDEVVGAGFPLYARCYRDGVERNAALDGVVRLRFVVNESGSVSAVLDAGSDLTDRQVVDCVAEAFFTLRFPEPERGSVKVLYRIHFGSS